MTRNVTAILVAYNSERIIGQALAALQDESAIAEIMVVDNASQDKTRGFIKREFPKVTLIENPENTGFGCANNMALSRITTDYALLVNPDAVMASGAIDALLAAAARYPDAAILAPALYDEQENLHHSFKRNVFNREASRDERIAADGELCAEFVSGAVMLLNMALMKKIGYFDPNIFLYYEDDDLCLRARRAGYSVVYVPQAKAIHLMGASGGRHTPGSEFFKQKHTSWSRLYIEEKYHGRPAAEAMAARLRKKYKLKLALYRLQLNRLRVSRYRGRLAGIAEFTARKQMSQAA